MGILSGVLGLASPALTVATQGLAGYGRGQMQGSQLLRAMQLEDEEKAREKELTDLSLTRQGIFPGSAPTTAAIPVDGPGGTVSVPSRYRQLTPGFYEDAPWTPDALAQQRERLRAEAAEKLATAKEALQAKLAAAREAAKPRVWQPSTKQEYLETHQPQPRGWQPSSKQEYIDVHNQPRTTTTNRPPSGQEYQAASLLPEIHDARQFLEQYEDPTVAQRIASKYGTFGNFLNSPEGRQFAQAANTYVQNIIYAKSGKAVTEAESRRLWDTYIIMPGDDTGTKARKRHTRELGEQAARIAAGRARPAADSAMAAAPAGAASAATSAKPTGHDVAKKYGIDLGRP